MAYFEFHDTLPDHFKTKKLTAILSTQKVTAVGYLACLFAWTIRFRPGGILEREIVAPAAEWIGDSEQFVKALVQSGFAEEKAEKIVIHDWSEYTKNYRRGKKEAARLRRKYRANLAQGSSLSAYEQNRTEQNGTEQSGEDSARALTRKSPSSWEDQQVLVWNKHIDCQPISIEKGSRLIRTSIARGANRGDIEHAIMNSSRCSGKRIWEVLDPITPKPKNPKQRSWMDEVNDLISGNGESNAGKH